MQITIYDFSKRKNSTVVPTSSGTVVECVLKDNCSIWNPSFRLKNIDSSAHYLKWNERYYFINDFQYNNVLNEITIECEIDLLATYKLNIRSTTAYVEYSSSNYDSYLPDSRLSMNETATYASAEDFPIHFSYGSGLQFVVSYVTSSQNNDGATGCMVMNRANLSLLGQDLMSEGFANILKDIEKQMASATDAVISCKWLPIEPSVRSGAMNIQLGTYTGSAVGYMVNRYSTGNFVIGIPWQFSDFRNLSPYTSLNLFLGGYGWVELNPNDFIGQSSINVKFYLDNFTGEVCYYISSHSRYVAQLGVDVPVGKNKSDSLGGLTNIVSGALNVGMGALTGDAVQLGVGGRQLIEGSILANSHNIGSVGNADGIASVLADGGFGGRLVTICHSTNVDPSNILSSNGRPLRQVVNLGTLSGYVETRNISVDTNLPSNLKTELNNLIDGGIFIE